MNFVAIASRSGTMPETGVYFVSPRRIAAMAASLMLSGVSKSGSPTDRLITSRPWAFRSRAFCVMTMVADGLMRDRASDKKPMEIPPIGALDKDRAAAADPSAVKPPKQAERPAVPNGF